MLTRVFVGASWRRACVVGLRDSRFSTRLAAIPADALNAADSPETRPRDEWRCCRATLWCSATTRCSPCYAASTPDARASSRSPPSPTRLSPTSPRRARVSRARRWSRHFGRPSRRSDWPGRRRCSCWTSGRRRPSRSSWLWRRARSGWPRGRCSSCWRWSLARCRPRPCRQRRRRRRHPTPA